MLGFVGTILGVIGDGYAWAWSLAPLPITLLTLAFLCGTGAMFAVDRR